MHRPRPVSAWTTSPLSAALRRASRCSTPPARTPIRSRSCCSARSPWPRATLSARSSGWNPSPRRAIRSLRSWKRGRTPSRAGGVRQAPRRHRSRRDRLARGERRAQARYGGERVRSVSLGRFRVEPFEQGRARHGSQRSLPHVRLSHHAHPLHARRRSTT